MAFTLSNMLYGAWAALGQTDETTATGGSTTTAIDTKLSGKYTDDDLVGGTIVVVRDAGGLGAAPEGEFARISAYSDGSQTFTIDTITTAIASGDRIGIVKPLYNLQVMIQRANEALREVGKIPLPDTSLTTVANQTEYALPVALKSARLIRVEVQTLKNVTGDNEWITIPNWRVVPASPGSTGLLILPSMIAGYTIKITYLGYHTAVNAFNDPISEYIDPRLAIKALELRALDWLISSKGQSATNFELQRWNKAATEYDQLQAKYPVFKEVNYPKFAVFSDAPDVDPPIGTVRL